MSFPSLSFIILNFRVGVKPSKFTPQLWIQNIPWLIFQKTCYLIVLSASIWIYSKRFVFFVSILDKIILNLSSSACSSEVWCLKIRNVKKIQYFLTLISKFLKTLTKLVLWYQSFYRVQSCKWTCCLTLENPVSVSA